MWHSTDSKNIKFALLFNSLLRWLFGIAFLVMAYYNYPKDGWLVLLLFGMVFTVTGFFRPKRCINNISNK